MTARALLRLLYWPFPTATALAWFAAGFIAGTAALFATVLGVALWH